MRNNRIRAIQNTVMKHNETSNYKKLKWKHWDSPIFLKINGNHSHTSWLCPSDGDGAKEKEIPLENNLSKAGTKQVFWTRTDII